MVTLIPQQPDFNASTAEARVWASTAEARVWASTAEARVWNSLCEQLPDEATMVHSQRLAGDDKDVESDILVLWPGIGIAVVEVKGGRVGVGDGAWITQRHRNRLKVSPLKQAMAVKHTLVD